MIRVIESWLSFSLAASAVSQGLHWLVRLYPHTDACRATNLRFGYSHRIVSQRLPAETLTEHLLESLTVWLEYKFTLNTSSISVPHRRGATTRRHWTCKWSFNRCRDCFSTASHRAQDCVEVAAASTPSRLSPPQPWEPSSLYLRRLRRHLLWTPSSQGMQPKMTRASSGTRCSSLCPGRSWWPVRPRRVPRK